MKNQIFRGVITALVTPFRNGNLDEEALRRHIQYQIEGGVQGVLPCGTTGESPTLSHEEHKRVVELTVAETGGRIRVLAGAGSNSTCEALDLVEHAARVGADGVLVVAPYYNKPTQEGLFLHYQALGQVGLPIIIYNIPGRCGVNILPETLARIAKEIPAVIGVKEATGDLNQMIQTIELCGPDFLVTSGDDSLTLPLLAVGGGGVISVASNLIPGSLVEMWCAWESGDLSGAREKFFHMLPLFRALFLETNPILVKTALSFMGRMVGEMRLPMCPPRAETIKVLRRSMEQWGL
ncbi:MAG: 4-hydroxy-tetrahydrodipicolinate synthase [Candidatus Adiutrix intracellularis]|nr:MAG: 4-hydroxy-tetrahydrodipicolinate synthase [Candidatus Adiutrix intracellularis]MDR2827591.1 4-hydroxy-tetrahydrodipicolinate synthase [Candidatus Adiutrix intracellularis]